MDSVCSTEEWEEILSKSLTGAKNIVVCGEVGVLINILTTGTPIVGIRNGVPGASHELIGYPMVQDGVQCVFWEVPRHGDDTVSLANSMRMLKTGFGAGKLNIDFVMLLTSDPHGVHLNPALYLDLMELASCPRENVAVVATNRDTWASAFPDASPADLEMILKLQVNEQLLAEVHNFVFVSESDSGQFEDLLKLITSHHPDLLSVFEFASGIRKCYVCGAKTQNPFRLSAAYSQSVAQSCPHVACCLDHLHSLFGLWVNLVAEGENLDAMWENLDAMLPVAPAQASVSDPVLDEEVDGEKLEVSTTEGSDVFSNHSGCCSNSEAGSSNREHATCDNNVDGENELFSDLQAYFPNKSVDILKQACACACGNLDLALEHLSQIASPSASDNE